jgi:hypothetical protein
LIRQKLPASLMSSTDFMTFKTSICEPAWRPERFDT